MIWIIFLFISSVSAQCSEEGNCEELHLPKDEIRVKENHVLQGYVIAEHFTPTQFGCFLRCADNCQCLSFNFKSDDGSGMPNCQLNEAATYTNPEAMKWKAEWSYIEMARSYLNAKVTEFVLLHDFLNSSKVQFHDFTFFFSCLTKFVFKTKKIFIFILLYQGKKHLERKLKAKEK